MLVERFGGCRDQLTCFALRFIHSHSDSTGIFRNAFLGNCRVDDFRQPC